MRPPYFAFYPADFTGDVLVESMTTLQVGAYILLLCKAWQSKPPASLPDDDRVLCRLARVEPQVWAKIKDGVMEPWERGDDGRWHNRRLRAEYDAATARISARKEGGSKGAGTRWRSRKTDSSPIGSPIGSPNGSVMPDPMTQPPKIQTEDIDTEKDRQTPLPPVHGGAENRRSVGGVDEIGAYDPWKAEQALCDAFVAAWNAAGLMPLQRLTHDLRGRLLSLANIPEWAEAWPAAIERCGRSAFLRDGVGRRKGRLDPIEFLTGDDFVRQAMAGRFDPKPEPTQPPPVAHGPRRAAASLIDAPLAPKMEFPPQGGRP